MILKKTFTSLILCKKKRYTPEMEEFFSDPDIAFDIPDNLLLKKGNSATVTKYTINENELVIKRYNMKTIVHALRRAFKKSRADHSWYYAHLLKKKKINTPYPVGMKEKRFGPFRNKAYLICEYMEGPTALNFFKSPQHTFQEKSIIAKQIIEIFNVLKSSMITHGDMKATNIIIHDNKPFLIDLDSMKAHKIKKRFIRAWNKDIKRFMKNWEDLPEIDQLFKLLKN